MSQSKTKTQRPQMPHRQGMVRRVDLERTGGSEFYGVPRQKLPIEERVRRLEVRMKVVEGFAGSQQERYDRLMTVKAVVREWYAMGPRMLSLQRKSEDVLWPRNVAMWLCENVAVLPRRIIAAHFGRKDYGAVVHAVKQVNNRMDVDEKFRADVAALEGKVRERIKVEEVP